MSRDRRLATAVRDDAGAGRTAIEPWANPIPSAAQKAPASRQAIQNPPRDYGPAICRAASHAPCCYDRFPGARSERTAVDQYAGADLTSVKRCWTASMVDSTAIAVDSIWCNAPHCASCSRLCRSRRTISTLREWLLLSASPLRYRNKSSLR